MTDQDTNEQRAQRAAKIGLRDLLSPLAIIVAGLMISHGVHKDGTITVRRNPRAWNPPLSPHQRNLPSRRLRPPTSPRSS